MKPQKASHQKQPEPPATLLSRCNADALRRQMQQVQLAITRRAYELFETRGREHGHDWEDWFRAQSELVRPVSVTLLESEDRISVRVNVLGFKENELKVSVEPRRLTILGEKAVSAMQAEGGTIEPLAGHSDQILQVIDLATDVTAENAVVELEAGLLKFELPKAAKQKVETATAA